MAGIERIELRVEPLGRDVLTGVLDPDGDGDDRVRIDVGIIPWFEDERPLKGLAGYIDWRSCGMLSRLLRSGWCSGRAGEAVLMPVREGLPVRRLVLLGLGHSDGITPDVAASAIEEVVGLTHRLRPRSVLFAMPGLLQERDVVEAVFTGLTRVLAHGPVPEPGASEDDPGPGVAAGEDEDAVEETAPDGDGDAEGEGVEDEGRDGDAGPDGEGAAEGAGSEDGDAGADRRAGADREMVEDEDRDEDAGPDGDGDVDRGGDASTGADAGSASDSAPSGDPAEAGAAGLRWWVVADARHVARLRRLLGGPPRAAGS